MLGCPVKKQLDNKDAPYEPVYLIKGGGGRGSHKIESIVSHGVEDQLRSLEQEEWGTVL